MIDIDVIIRKRGNAHSELPLDIQDFIELRDKLNFLIRQKPNPQQINFNIDIKTPEDLGVILKELFRNEFDNKH